MICNNLFSRTTLSKIENNQVNPSLLLSISILRRLDVSYDEFLYIQNDYSLPPKQNIVNKFKNVSNNLEDNCLEDLISLCSNYLEQCDDFLVEDILHIVQAMILLRKKNSFNESKTLVMPVWERLQNLENWFLDEIYIINNIFFLFDSNTGTTMIKRALKSIERYSSYQNIYTLKIALTLNLIYLKLFNNKDYLASTVVDETIQYCKSIKRYDLMAIAYIRKGILNPSLDKKNNENITYGLSILRILKLDSILIEMEKEIEQFMQ